MFENEKWLPIDEFPHYLVSNCGRVKHTTSVKARRLQPNERGFPLVALLGAGTPSRYLRQVNLLVARAFVPTPVDADATSIWHIDGDLMNCRADNLKWETRARVLEWNDMHRRSTPKLVTNRVVNNTSGRVYENAFECGLEEGMLETEVAWLIERYPIEDMLAGAGRFRYQLRSEY